jgi:phage-related protein
VPFEVVFYVTERGEFPVLDFMATLSAKEFAKSVAYMTILQESGSNLPANFVVHLGEGLYELRPEFGGVEMRYFYFTVLGETIVKLHAIKKKTRKTPPRDLALARKRMEECKPE